MESPKDETPGWHASDLETSQNMAWNNDLVRMERAEFTFPMNHHEFIESGTIENLLRATAEKGEEAFKFSPYSIKFNLDVFFALHGIVLAG